MFSIRIPVVPDGWRIAMCIYAFCVALAFIITPSLYSTPPFQVFRQYGVPVWCWSTVLLLYSVGGLLTVLFPVKAYYAAIGVLGVLMWSFFGTELLASGLLEHRQISPAGLFSLSGAVGCFLTVLQSVDKGSR